MIRFVTALAAEAEPIVERYGMTPRDGAFAWFRSEEAALVVSGVGKIAAASAVAYLHARTEEREHAAWIDAGLAGHRDREPGEVLLAHTVRDAASGRSWHPTPLGGVELPRVEVVTVDRPESRFDAEAAYDMEAAGFVPAALRFSSTELVQVIKVVSDNRKTPWTGLTPRDARELVARGFDAIQTLASRLRELALELVSATAPPPELEAYAARFRLTVSERRKLERLLERWRALDPEAERGPERVAQASSPREAIARVEAHVRRAAREQPL